MTMDVVQAASGNIFLAFGLGTIGLVTAFLDSTDMTEVLLAFIAMIGVVGAAWANNRGAKQEAKTKSMKVNIDANNTLIDQLQEETTRLHDLLREAREDEAALRREIEELKNPSG